MTSLAPTLTDPALRPLGPALRLGWARRCPACGKGAMMQGYLSVRHECDSCGEVLSHHRADDGPAYLTILIVGHVMVPILLAVFVKYRLEPLELFGIFGAGTVVLSLFLLPRLKGAMVALQWAKRMHGFGGTTPGAV